SDLSNVYVRNSIGNLIQMSNLVQFNEESNPPTLFRYDRYIAATVSADMAEGYTLGQGIEEMDKNQKQIITQSLQDSHQPTIIKSSFEISPESKQQIIKALQIQAINDNLLKFEPSPDLICGIQVKLAAYVISWNLDDYLQTLESRFQQLGMNS
ncbi:MAG: AcrB/AcrD/AcrF family protein, partial [Richelia sp. SM2_1_7]|nr:AcrB/AcrD/AcrF family protein [Richelia sp. SM2_1_7]